MKAFAIRLVFFCFAFVHVYAQTPDTVFLEELTWTEVRQAIDSGTTTVIVPTAGTEQNGPHMVLGKHKYRINAGAERIARELGNTFVAPVMTYVPEGAIEPPEGHMRYAGTISISNELFEQLLESTARSLAAHGFTDVLFIGDSGPNQAGQERVATILNQEWADRPARVLAVSDWYTASAAFIDWLKEQGESEASIGTHAGLYDTALLMAVAPQHVRTETMSEGRGLDADGVVGDPTRATGAIGQVGLDLMHDAAMQQIRSYLSAR